MPNWSAFLFKKITISKRPFSGVFPFSFGYLIALEKGYFCSYVFNGIYMKLLVKLSNSPSF